MLIKAEPGASCRELGDVDTGNHWLRTVGDVKIELRNQAAALGANVATLDVLKQSPGLPDRPGTLVGGSGRAFACP